MSSGDAIRDERLKKLEILRDAGMEAYPVESLRSTSNVDFLDAFEESAPAVLAGRVMSRRGQGGICLPICMTAPQRLS
jgi:lysyl-tRNA synthetase class II